MRSGLYVRVSAKNRWYVTWHTRIPFGVEYVTYNTQLDTIAHGITNHTIDNNGKDLLAVFFERDEPIDDVDAYIMQLREAGFSPWLVAYTSRGVHAILRDFVVSKAAVVKILKRAHEKGLCDEGFVDLAELRAKDPMVGFTSFLRLKGKYDTDDVFVKRVAPPPSKWHARVWFLYRVQTLVQISASQYAYGCLGFTPRPHPGMLAGKAAHEVWEAFRKAEGFEVERPFVVQRDNIVYIGTVDAIQEAADGIIIKEFKSTREAFESERALRQLRFYANVLALVSGRPVQMHLETVDKARLLGVLTPEEAQLPVPEDAMPKQTPIYACRYCLLHPCANAQILFEEGGESERGE